MFIIKNSNNTINHNYKLLTKNYKELHKISSPRNNKLTLNNHMHQRNNSQLGKNIFKK